MRLRGFGSSRTPAIWPVALSVVCLLGSQSIHADATALAQHLLSKAGMSSGVACVLRCGNGDLPVALAAGSDMLVMACDQSSANVRTATNAADAAHLLGRSVYVAQAGPAAVPFANNYVDLLVIDGAASGDLSGIPQAQILRVLTPFRGTAIVGSSAGSGLTEAALQTWANGFSGARTSVSTDAHGVWAVVHKPALAGSDDWTHRYHGSDNNPVSRDQAYSFPNMTQWMGKPYAEMHGDGEHHVANGRLVVMAKHPTWKDFPISNVFCARSVYNGQMLWQRDLPYKYRPGNGVMVLTGDSVVMCLGRGAAVLDAETGTELGRITFTDVEGCAKWISIADGVVVILAGGSDCSLDFPAPGSVTDQKLKDSCYNAPQPEPQGAEIAAYDLSTATFLWRHVESAPIDIRFIAAHNGRVYFLAHGSRAAALNLRTGAQEWQNTTQALRDAAAMKSDLLGGMYEVQRGITLHPRVIVFGMEYSYNYVGLSITDGSIAWTNARAANAIDRSPIASLALGNEFWTKKKVLNILTGDSLRTAGMSLAGCGTMTATENLIVGQCGLAKDYLTETSYPINGMHKSPCENGGFVANGMHVQTSFTCTCDMITRGYKTMGAAGSFTFNRSATADRLTVGPGSLQDVQALTVGADDWPTYRADIGHTAGSSASVSGSPHLAWTFTPSTVNTQDFRDIQGTRHAVDHKPTQAVAVGGYVFVGGSDGSVRCIEKASSLPKWTYWTGGAIFAAPTVCNGRVYVGSADGYAYALEALTGRLLWKFRAAPVERRVMMYGQLMSTWPVVTGVTVKDGVAYFGAGYNAEDGSHVYAVNATTGAIVWQNNTIGHSTTLPHMGRNIVGGMTIARGRVWLRSSRYGTTSLDLVDGTLKPGPVDQENSSSKNQGVMGADISVFKERFVLYGGQPLFSDHCEYQGTVFKLSRWAHRSFLELDTDGSPLYPEVEPFVGQHALQQPAWDDELMVVVQDDHEDVYGWSVPKTETYLDSVRDANASVSYPWYRRSTVADADDLDAHPMKLWGPLGVRVNSLVVAANAAVMAFTEDNGSTWKLRGLAKQTGATLWTVDLPMEPVFEGLSVASDGTVLVALRDGRIQAYGDGTVGVTHAVAQTSSPDMPVVPSQVKTNSWQRASDQGVSSAPATETSVASMGTEKEHQPVAPEATSRPSHAELLAADLQPWQYREIAPDMPEEALPAPGTLGQEAPAPVHVHHDMTWRPHEACLPVVSVAASSEGDEHTAAESVDRDLRTRWHASGDPNPWIVYDLGRESVVSAATIVWYGKRSSRTDMRIETSLDGRVYEEVDAGTLEGRGASTTLRSFLPSPARFVRISLGSSGGEEHPSLCEVGFHAPGAAQREASAVR